MFENINEMIGNQIRVECIKDIPSSGYDFFDSHTDPNDFTSGNVYDAKIEHSGYESKTVHLSARSNNPITCILYGSNSNGVLDESSKMWFNEHFKIVS